MKYFYVCFSLLLLCAVSSAQASRGEWQWSVTVPTIVSAETDDYSRAFLWIPEDCREVRAVVVGQHNMCEETLFENPLFRAEMQRQGVALVWITPILDFPWDVKNGCNRALLSALDELAEASGYGELKYAPVVPVGHSAMATFPWNFAAWNPERTLAVISYHGDAPRTNLTGYGGENLEWGRTRNIDGIPGLMIEGEYEWWEARVNPALAFRMMYPESCISFLCDAGRGHFDVADRTARYIALFLKKALEQRLPADAEVGKPVSLKKLNPADGWLAERWRTGSVAAVETREAVSGKAPKRAKPAPFLKYKGDPHDAFWYFDKEMAELTESIYENEANKKMQFVGFMQNGKILPYDSKSHVRVSARFEPDLSDGLTFHLTPVYLNAARDEVSDEHASVPAVITRICGPVRKLDDTTFVVDFYRMGMYNKRRTSEICLLVSSEGDEQFKSTVQELSFRIPYRHTEGRRQCILFPGIPDVEAGTESVTLSATSDCGLPVSYYVKEGPAYIDGDELKFSAIPPRTRFPMKVTVVAWQYGIAGKIQTADPVERTFFLTKPLR